MKKLILMLALVMTSTLAFGQTTKSTPAPKDNSYEKRLDSLLVNIETLLERNGRVLEDIEEQTTSAPRYKMYKTENIYNLLLLDTQTGKIKQVQWSLNSSNQGTMSINSSDYSYFGYGPGSFELYATNNMYQFILVDTHDGRLWHVQ